MQSSTLTFDLQDNSVISTIKESEEQQLISRIAGKIYNHLLVQQVVRSCFANSHQGSKKQKNMSEKRGGGKKPFEQKGTGRARTSSIRSTIWTGGAKVFAARGIPKRQLKINRSMYKGCLKSILFKLYEDHQLKIVEDVNLEGISKTKELASALHCLDQKKRHLILSSTPDQSKPLESLTNNLPYLDISLLDRKAKFNPVDLLKYDHIWLTKSCVDTLEKTLLNK